MNRQSWIALKTLVGKEVNRFSRIWIQTLMPSVVTSVLYFIIFGRLIGHRIGNIEGFSYLQFIVPGLTMMAVITNAYSNVAFSFFHAKFQRSIEELLVAPVSTGIIICGFVVAGTARGLCVGALVILTASLFMPLHLYNPWAVLAILLLTAVLFSLCGLLNALYAESFDTINIIPTFVLTPLTYLGGVFYSLALLPKFWQWISQLNPIVYMVNGVRFGFLGVSDISLFRIFSLLTILTIVLYYIVWQLIDRGCGLRS